MMPKPIEINRAPTGWPALAQTLLASGHRWSPWEKSFLAKIASLTSHQPTERQIETLIELDARMPL